VHAIGEDGGNAGGSLCSLVGLAITKTKPEGSIPLALLL